MRPTFDEDEGAHDDEGYGGWIECWDCGGEGTYVSCPDDLCHGMEECIHGDPPSACPECKGAGGWPSKETE